MSEGTNEPTDMVILITTLTKDWEQYYVQDDDLWESFRENFEGHTEDDFKIPSNTQIRKFRELLRKQGVWVLKNPKVSVAKSLFNTLQEEIPTRWTEDEVTKCQDKEVFTSTSRHNFGRNPRWRIPSPMFPGLPSVLPSAHSAASVQDQRPIKQGQQPEILPFQ